MKKSLLIMLLIVGGMVLALPVGAFSPPTQESKSTEVVVTTDDWLSKLAEKYLGNPADYPAITYYTNKKQVEDDRFAKIFNSDFIEVGERVYIPSAEETTAYFERKQIFADNSNKTFGLLTSLESIDPFSNTTISTADLFVEPLLFDSLITLDEDGVAQPTLAESWAFSGDNPTLVTLTLRKDITYHNGEPFDADHLTAYWSQLPSLYQDFACPAANSVDTHTVQLTCYGLDSTAIERLLSELPIIHPAYFTDKERALFGTGPFQVNYGDQDSGEPITLVKNPTFWGDSNTESPDWTFQLDPNPANLISQDLDKLAAIIDIESALIGNTDLFTIHTPEEFVNLIGGGDCPFCARLPKEGNQGGQTVNPVVTRTPTPTTNG